MLVSDWWTNLTRRAKVATVFLGFGATTSGFIVGIPAAWGVIGLPTPASREYVLSQLSDIKRDQQQTHQLLLEIRRGQLDREVIDLERRSNRSIDDDVRLHQLRDQLLRLNDRR